MPHLPCPPSSVIPSSKYIYFSRTRDHVHPHTKFIFAHRKSISDENCGESKTHISHPILFSHETRCIHFRTSLGLSKDKSWPGRRSLHSCSLRAGRSGDQIQVRQDFPHASRPALGPNQLPLQWVLVLVPRDKAAGVWRSPSILIYRWGWRKSITVLPLTLRAFMACYRVKFIFYFY